MRSRAFLLSLSLLPACREEADEPSPFVQGCTEVLAFGAGCSDVSIDVEAAQRDFELYCVGVAQIVGLEYDPACLDAVAELGACISGLSCDVLTEGPLTWPDEDCRGAYETAHEGCESLVPYCIQAPHSGDACHILRPVCVDQHSYAVDCLDPMPEDNLSQPRDCTCRRDGQVAGTFTDDGTCASRELSRLATEHCDFPPGWR